MKMSILSLNIFIISLMVMYIHAKHLQNLDDSSQLVTQISDDSRIDKMNIIRSHHENINQAAFIKRKDDENNRKDEQNLRLIVKRKYYKKFSLTTEPYVSNPKACPKGTIWRMGKCVKAYSTDWW